MQEKDAISIDFFEDPVRFADLVNGYVYEGQEKICPENIREVNRSVARIAKKNKNLKAQVITADIMREVSVEMRVAIIALENQSDIHYAMPVRVMNVESAVYHRQWRQRAAYHKKQKKLRGAEYLSGFSKEDKLIPTITIVVYLGKEPWDGPISLKEMMDLEGYSEAVQNMIADYPIHLLEVRKYKQLEYFHSDIQYVFGFLQNDSNEEQLKAYVKANEQVFSKLEESAFDMISVMSHSKNLYELKEQYEEKEGGVNMCKAIDDMIESGRREGIEQGIEQGIEKGIRQGVVALIQTCQELGVTKEDTLSKLLRIFALEKEVAEDYMCKNWQEEKMF